MFLVIKYSVTSSIALIFETISSRAFDIRSRITYLVWFWASLPLLSCGLHTSCPNRQTGSDWFLLFLADWSTSACSAACWIPGREDTVLLEICVTQPLFRKAHHMLVFETCDFTIQRTYYTKPWCVVLCNHCVSHAFSFCICQPQYSDLDNDS